MTKYSGMASLILDGKKHCANPNCPMDNPQPLAQFHRDRNRANGFKFRCRTCTFFELHGYWPDWAGLYFPPPIERDDTKGNHKPRHTLVGRQLIKNGYPLFDGKHGSTRRWSEDEEEFLDTHYGLSPDWWLSQQLKRSEDAMRVKSHVMGLTKRDNFMTSGNVRRILCVSRSTVNVWITTGKLRAKRSIGTGDRKRPHWHVDESFLEAFMRRFPNYYDWRKIDREAYPYWYEVGKEAAASVAKEQTQPRANVYTPHPPTRVWAVEIDREGRRFYGERIA